MKPKILCGSKGRAEQVPDRNGEEWWRAFGPLSGSLPREADVQDRAPEGGLMQFQPHCFINQNSPGLQPSARRPGLAFSLAQGMLTIKG